MSGHFSVKNFEKYQHYKDRRPPWIKLYNELLEDYDFGLLPDASKWQLVAIFLLASRYDNRIPADADWVARKISATSVVDLTLLAKAGFIVMDQVRTEPLALCYQPAIPEEETETQVTTQRQRDIGPSQAKPDKPKRERKVLSSLPDDCPSEFDRCAAEKYWRDRSRDDLCARLGDEVQAFRDHHRGRGNRMADWSAAWRTWYGNALKFNRPGPNTSAFPTATIHKVVQ